jgi:hypothetical protein
MLSNRGMRVSVIQRVQENPHIRGFSIHGLPRAEKKFGKLKK